MCNATVQPHPSADIPYSRDYAHALHLTSSFVRVEALRSRNRATHTPSSLPSSAISATPPARIAAYCLQPLSDVSDVTRSSASDTAAQPATPS